MATLWPTVHARLVTLLPTLTGWAGVTVFDGPVVTGDAPTDYASVGYVLLEDSAGDYTFERHSDGWGVTEVGTVRCEVVTTSGSTDLVEVRDRAFALADALAVEIRRDPGLGVLPSASTMFLTVDVLPAQTSAGAQQRLALSVNYTATT